MLETVFKSVVLLRKVVNHANNIDKHLLFKLSMEENNIIDYLDLSIYRNTLDCL
jgi:hypothetical protein